LDLRTALIIKCCNGIFRVMTGKPDWYYQVKQCTMGSSLAAGRRSPLIKKVFWTLFVAMAGLVMAWVVDPVTAQQVVRIITGMGV
jgi:hypothetical protein